MIELLLQILLKLATAGRLRENKKTPFNGVGISTLAVQRSASTHFAKLRSTPVTTLLSAHCTYA